MAYEFKKLPTGNIEVYEDGKRVATASASGARQYGYTEGGQPPAPTPNPIAPIIPEQKPAPLPALAPAPTPIPAPAPVAGQGQPQPAPTGSIVDYLKSLNTLRAEGDKGAPKSKTQPTAQPGAVQPAPVAPGATPAAVIQPEQAATVSFDDLMAQFGIQPSESISDVVASISKLYGFDEVNDEIKKLDKEFEDAAEKENMDPWISEGTRSRRLEQMQNKYELKKKNLLDRLSIRSDIIGKSITAYNTEKTYKQNMLFKALDLRQKQMEAEQDRLERETLTPYQEETLGLRREQIAQSAESRNMLNLIRELTLKQKTGVSPGQIVDASTGLPVKLTDAQSQFFSMGIRLNDTTEGIRDIINRVGTGAIKGWVTEKGYLIPVVQNVLDPDQQDLMQKMFELNNMFVYFSTGKQINETEFERLSKQTPQFRATPEYNKSAIDNFSSMIQDRMANYMTVNGWTFAGQGGGQSDGGETRIYNGATYKKVEGGWQKVQ